jgi:hypothetical protein
MSSAFDDVVGGLDARTRLRGPALQCAIEMQDEQI